VDQVGFLEDLWHLHDWAEENGRMGTGFTADMVTFFREDLELRRHMSRALVSAGKAVCEACHKVLNIRGKGAAMRCSRCKQAFYCSRKCQRSAYPGHRRFCTPVPRAGPENKV